MRNILFSSTAILLLVLACPQKLAAQLKVGANPTTMSNASLLELEATDKGFVFPRVSLSSLATASPLASDLLVGTTVYNTNTALAAGAGLYLWNGSSWQSTSLTTASNGLARLGKDIQLGGTLTQNTTIANAGYNVIFTGSGNVGVGLTNPAAPLSVNASGNNTGVLKLSVPSGNTGDQWWLAFNHAGTSADNTDRARIGVNIASGGAGRLFFTTGASGSQAERMRIDQNGYVGIGTDAPTVPLDVAGNMRLRSLTSAGIVTNDANGNLGGGAVSNGLTQNAYSVKLGGTLTQNTSIDAGTTGYGLSVTSTGMGAPYGTTSVVCQQFPWDYEWLLPSVLNAWQAFTSPKTGLLTSVELPFTTISSTFGAINFTLKVYSGTGTGGALLATSIVNYTVTAADGAYTLSFPFSSLPLVKNGQVYTIALSTNSMVSWGTKVFNPGGTSSNTNQTGFSFCFTSYMRESLNIPSGLMVKDGNVGIGTTTPQHGFRLDVADNFNSTSLLLRNGNGSSAIANQQVAFGYNGTAEYMHAIKTRHNGGDLSGNAIDFYVWNQGTDDAGTVGTKRVMTIDGGGSNSTGTLEVNGKIRQQTYSQGVTVPGLGTWAFTWTHNFGYRPVIMISLDQTGAAGYMDYCHVAYGHNSDNQLTIYLSNRNAATAGGTVRWIVVN